ncbi:hypothetical protein [Lunatimonas salinarum]|uniref:hypothetical protein n=1 Tax=Lunatimonas salinarum TaxID=1774590 RepID=UPI001ADF953A|nr:hypothetical protein [Lunatimonas salinarum]
MLKKVFLLQCLLLASLMAVESVAQIAKQFVVEERDGFDLVNFEFSCYKGVSDFKRGYYGKPIFATAELGKVNILPSFSYQIKGGVLAARLEHKNVESESLGRSLSYRLFSNTDEDFDHHWEVGLDPNYLYNLNLHFGIGKAHLDFSSLPVSNCKIKTASADVYLAYASKLPNSINMDTLSVTINMGALYGDDLHFSNARQMMFDVSYGSVNLNFSDLMAEASQVYTKVAAGSVNITLPHQDLPYLVKIKSTAMCRTKLPTHLREIGDKVYVSNGYKEDAKNLMTFMIDVSVGSVYLK